MASLVKFAYFKRRKNTKHSKRKEKKKQTLSISCDGASINLVLKPEKDITRKEGDRPLSLRNKDLEIITKIFKFKSLDK